jgi:7-cyano-7-deazaguanine synthase in queuosine biosynthesis
MRLVVLLTGSLDSAVALAEACNRTSPADTHAIFMTQGRGDPRAAAAMAQCRHYKVARTRFADPQARCLPLDAPFYRYGLALAHAIAVAEAIEADVVWTGQHAGEACLTADQRPEYRDALDCAATLGTRSRIKVQAPFADLTGEQVTHIAGRLEVPFELTYDCAGSDGVHCGCCLGCVRRSTRFRLAEIPDGTEYRLVLA